MSASTRASNPELDVTPTSREDASALAVSATRARLALVQQTRREAIYAARRGRSARATDPGLGPARAQQITLDDSGATAPSPAPPKSKVGLALAVLTALGTLAAAVQQLVSALGH